jgi:hypothetical protein
MQSPSCHGPPFFSRLTLILTCLIGEANGLLSSGLPHPCHFCMFFSITGGPEPLTHPKNPLHSKYDLKLHCPCLYYLLNCVSFPFFLSVSFSFSSFLSIIYLSVYLYIYHQVKVKEIYSIKCCFPVKQSCQHCQVL